MVKMGLGYKFWTEHFKTTELDQEELIAALIALGVDEDVLPKAENQKLRMFLRTEIAIRLIEPNPTALKLLEANLVELQAPSWFVEERREKRVRQERIRDEV